MKKTVRPLIVLLTSYLVSAAANAQEAPPTTPERRIADEIILYRELRDGVVTVEAGSGHGTGFIVDPRGLIITNQHVVRGAVKTRVRFDEETKVDARVLATDPRADVAVLWVNLKAFPKFKVLKIAQTKPSVVEGEKVLAIGSPLSQRKVLTVGIVSKVEERVIFSDVNINPGNSGGPLFNSLGEVVGITTFGEQRGSGPGISGIIRIEQAQSALQQAEKAMASGHPPSAELLPVEPKMKFPIDGLAKAITDESYEPEHYRFETDQYEVVLSTPVLNMYMMAGTRIEAARRKFKERKNKPNAMNVSIDPLDDLKDYLGNVGGYDAVVTITAFPKVKETGKSIFVRSLMAGLAAAGGSASYMPGRYVWDAEFYDMKLLCNGEEVIPITAGRVEHVGDLPSYHGRDAHYTYYGHFSYWPDVFNPSICRQLTLVIHSEEDPAKAETKVLDKKVVSRVWTDFGEYMAARKTAAQN